MSHLRTHPAIYLIFSILCIIPIINSLQIPIDTPNSIFPAFKVFMPRETQLRLLQATIPAIRAYILQEGDLPDQNVVTNIPIIGDVDISLSRLRLTDISELHDRVDVHIDRGHWGLMLGVDPAWMYVNVEGTFRTRQRNWPHITTDGTFKANIGMQMILGLKMERDASEKCLMKVSAVDSSVAVQRFTLDLHGAQAWLLDIFMKILKPRLISSLQDVMTRIVPDIIVALLQQSLNELQFRFGFGEASWNILVDFALKTFDIGEGDVAVFGGSGEFQKDDVIRYPADPEYVPFIKYNESAAFDRSMQIVLDEYALQSLAFVLHKGAILHEVYLIPDITTDNFSSINEFIPKKFPNSPIQVSVTTAEMPRVQITPGLMHIVAPCELVYQALMGEGERQEAVSLFTIGARLVANITANVTPEASKVYGSVNFLGDQTKYEIISSEVGEIHHLDYLSIGMDIMIQQVIATVINPRAREGFSLPSLPNLRLSNAMMVKNFSGYVVVNADVDIVDLLGDEHDKRILPFDDAIRL